MKIYACTARIFFYNESGEHKGESLFCVLTKADCEEKAEQKIIIYLKKILPITAKIHSLVATDRYFHDNTKSFEQEKIIIVEE